MHLEQQLAPWRTALLNHALYPELRRLDALQHFMQHHVFAVWDFMSLLKELQRQLCCVTIPWQVPADSQLCRFLNEIVLAEESDDDGQGGHASHFELYHRAMTQAGASTDSVDQFQAELRRGISVERALVSAAVPDAARRFVETTFAILQRGDLCAIASAFTFGREDLLPDVFQCIVDELNAETGGQLNLFQYYLQRHIGLDGDEHGPMAARLMQTICGSDSERWERAESAAVTSLKARLALWDSIAADVAQ